MIEIINYDSKYKEAFKSLNVAWLEKYFFVEEYDNQVLSNPEKYILEKGGKIFFIIENEAAIGTVALMINKKNELELTKMAITENSKGKGYGNDLMQFAIEESKKINNNELILYSNTSLEPAINLYKKYGFVEIPVQESEYKRCNIKMSLKL